MCILSYNQIKNTASPDVFLMAARTTCSLSLSLAQHNMKLAKEEGATKELCDYQSGASCPHSLTCGYLANVVVDALIYNTAQYCVLRLFSRLPRMCMRVSVIEFGWVLVQRVKPQLYHINKVKEISL